jgi:hypothetical protein
VSFSRIGISFDSNCVYVGEWLLNARLLNKRLDIRIQGTKETLVHNGRYENERGFTVLTKLPPDVNHRLLVKLGYAQSRVFFPACHIFPETTTTRPGFVVAGRPVVSTPGERVVIVGEDGEGKLDYVGTFALITSCPWVLAPGNTLVMITTPGPFLGKHLYFNEKSLCRSHAESIEWMGQIFV